MVPKKVAQLTQESCIEFRCLSPGLESDACSRRAWDFENESIQNPCLIPPPPLGRSGFEGLCLSWDFRGRLLELGAKV